MGLEQGKNIMNVIMQTVKREGKYELPVRDNVQPEDLMANKLVGYKVLKRKLVRNYPKAADIYEYNAGENFDQADVKGAHKFLEEEKKRINKKTFLTTYQYIYLPIFLLFGSFGIFKSYSDSELKSNYNNLKIQSDSINKNYKNVITKYDSLKKAYRIKSTEFDSLENKITQLTNDKLNDTTLVKIKK
ncbi:MULTISPECIES: hypothetical protein [unclassified Cellulophaga]|uniref:hypothetical protein n=1 Tax=unclassified Cellulophaga TaxID=2634405 RepID=UPI0026E3DECE|nr:MULTISPECIES: hypothetical protein [unclassified Cellulophaga]